MQLVRRAEVVSAGSMSEVPAAAEQLKALIARHRAGEYAAAEQGYREYLRARPEDATALHFLGLLQTQQGRREDGIALMDAAVRLDPDYVDAWSNLGIAFFHQGDFDRAEKCCRKALQLAPEFANAWGNLGMALRAKDANEETLQAWSRALELQPGMRNIAIPYGQLLYKMNRVEEARGFYRKWCDANPDDPIACHMLAAMGGSARPDRASDGYVRQTFDDFADSFDERLGDLQYHAPELLHHAAFNTAAESSSSGLHILDLGCGTGLCGLLFEPMAQRLVGVDLSCKMLAKAAARGCYQQLNHSELTNYLYSCRDRFDLVLAADVLCYFGELSAVFEGVRNVLAPGGRFIFSLEAANDSSGFTIRPHGRYEHDRGYVQQTLDAAGLRQVALFEDTLRFERGSPVKGLIVVAATT
jgi:predicted TPR repeat methyltransferase